MLQLPQKLFPALTRKLRLPCSSSQAMYLQSYSTCLSYLSTLSPMSSTSPEFTLHLTCTVCVHTASTQGTALWWEAERAANFSCTAWRKKESTLSAHRQLQTHLRFSAASCWVPSDCPFSVLWGTEPLHLFLSNPWWALRAGSSLPLGFQRRAREWG